VKTPSGLKWLTVPVHYNLGWTIDHVQISASQGDWRSIHRSKLIESLESAQFFGDALALWEDGVSASETLLSRLNVRLIKLICDYLKIRTPILSSREFALSGVKTERLIQLFKKVEATTYVSGPAAKDYLDEGLFRQNGIRLEYKTYDYVPYPQLWGTFVGNVTVLDLIANTGPSARDFLKSNTPNQVVVE